MSDSDRAAIGMVVIESTYLERHVEFLIWRLCGLDPEQGKLFTTRMQMDSRLDLLRDLAKPKIKDPTKCAVFTKIISDLKVTNNDRNTVIHGLWFAKSKGIFEWETPTPTATKQRLNRPPLTMSANQIAEVARKISSGAHDLVEFAKKEWPESQP
jgi:hypothetical protein